MAVDSGLIAPIIRSSRDAEGSAQIAAESGRNPRRTGLHVASRKLDRASGRHLLPVSATRHSCSASSPSALDSISTTAPRPKQPFGRGSAEAPRRPAAMRARTTAQMTFPSPHSATTAPMDGADRPLQARRVQIAVTGRSDHDDRLAEAPFSSHMECGADGDSRQGGGAPSVSSQPSTGPVLLTPPPSSGCWKSDGLGSCVNRFARRPMGSLSPSAMRRCPPITEGVRRDHCQTKPS